MEVTRLETARSLSGLLGYGSGFVGAVLIGAGIMAVIAGSKGVHMSGYHRGPMFIPQQLLMLLQIWSISAALGWLAIPMVTPRKATGGSFWPQVGGLPGAEGGRRVAAMIRYLVEAD